jgi:hypothetical protein
MLGKLGFILANIFVMIVLHGNSKQFWPKIPWLSLRDESIAEHTRLLFNTLTVVSLGQALLGRLPRQRWLPRLVVILTIPASLPALILFGQRVLRLKGSHAETYNLSLVPLLPIAAVVLEDRLSHTSEQKPI